VAKETMRPGVTSTQTAEPAPWQPATCAGEEEKPVVVQKTAEVKKRCDRSRGRPQPTRGRGPVVPSQSCSRGNVLEARFRAPFPRQERVGDAVTWSTAAGRAEGRTVVPGAVVHGRDARAWPAGEGCGGAHGALHGARVASGAGAYCDRARVAR